MAEAKAPSHGGARAWLARDPGRPLPRRQLRRSRFVTMMRLLLPLSAVALIALVVAWPQLVRQHDGGSLSFGAIEQGEDGARMMNARYEGIDSNGRPFVVTADSAVPDPHNNRQVTMNTLAADMTLEDGTWLTVKSRTGFYDEEAKLLFLDGGVSVHSDNGYEFHGENARVDLDTGIVTSERPVDGQGPTGLLRANGFRLAGKGSNIHFENGVRVTLFPNRQG